MTESRSAASMTIGESLALAGQSLDTTNAVDQTLGASIDARGDQDRAGMLGPVDPVMSMADTPAPLIPAHLLPRPTMPIEITPDLVQALAADVAPLLVEAVTQSVAQAVADALANQEGN